MRKQKHGNSQWLVAILMVIVLVVSAVAYHFKNQSEVREDQPEVIVTLRVLGSDGSKIVRLNADDSLQTIAKGWSPDVSVDGLLAYTVGSYSQNSIEVRDLETGELDLEFMAVIRQLESEGYHLWSPLWSSNGEKIAVYANHTQWQGNFTMFITREYGTQIAPPGWRPIGWYDDTQVILDNAPLPDEGPNTLMVMNEYGGWDIGQRHPHSYGSVVVNNGVILYEDYDPISDQTNLMSLRRGEPIRPETAHLLISNAREGIFSPDGSQIAYLTGDLNHWTNGGVWVANADGSNARMVYRNDDIGTSLQWVGDRIYFVIGTLRAQDIESVDDTLVSIRSDGTDIMMHDFQSAQVSSFTVR